MDFARKILNKYGWKEGDGLGRNSDGIVKPIKASMKFDNTGLGADQAASDFNNHWWERVFNEAASNVEIKSGEHGSVNMDLKNEDDRVEISTKGYSLKKLKKAKSQRGGNMQYENFLQSATLTKAGDEIENPEKIPLADIAVTQYKVLTDEELFQACGGRTAHKGARHGLKLSGKLSRLEQQEQELLAKMQRNTASSKIKETNGLEKVKNKHKTKVGVETPPQEMQTFLDCNTSAGKGRPVCKVEPHESKVNKKRRGEEIADEVVSEVSAICSELKGNAPSKIKKTNGFEKAKKKKNKAKVDVGTPPQEMQIFLDGNASAGKDRPVSKLEPHEFKVNKKRRGEEIVDEVSAICSESKGNAPSSKKKETNVLEKAKKKKNKAEVDVETPLQEMQTFLDGNTSAGKDRPVSKLEPYESKVNKKRCGEEIVDEVVPEVSVIFSVSKAKKPNKTPGKDQETTRTSTVLRKKTKVS